MATRKSKDTGSMSRQARKRKAKRIRKTKEERARHKAKTANA